MTNETKNLLTKIKHSAKELGIQAKQEIYVSLSKAIQFIPSVVGNELVLATFVPMIPSLLYDTVKREIFEKDVSDLGKRLFEEREKINKEFINSLLGRKIFKDIIKEIFEETDRYKIEYLKQFLLNSYVTVDTNNQEKSEILEILKSLQPTQLQILRALVNPEDTTDKIIQKWRSQRHQSWALRDDLRDIFQLDVEFFNRSISKLESSGLITIDKGALVQWNTGIYVEENIDKTKNQMMRGYQKLVTEFGQKFVKSISEIHDS